MSEAENHAADERVEKGRFASLDLTDDRNPGRPVIEASTDLAELVARAAIDSILDIVQRTAKIIELLFLKRRDFHNQAPVLAVAGCPEASAFALLANMFEATDFIAATRSSSAGFVPSGMKSWSTQAMKSSTQASLS